MTEPTIGPEEDSEFDLPEWDGTDESEGETNLEDEGFEFDQGDEPDVH